MAKKTKLNLSLEIDSDILTEKECEIILDLLKEYINVPNFPKKYDGIKNGRTMSWEFVNETTEKMENSQTHLPKQVRTKKAAATYLGITESEAMSLGIDSSTGYVSPGPKK